MCCHDWEYARTKVQSLHPFLLGREWLAQLDTADWDTLWSEIQHPECFFSSIQLYMELWDRPVPCLQFNGKEGLVLYALQGVIEHGLSTKEWTETYFKAQQLEVALEVASTHRERYPEAWVVKADIQAFFRSVAHQHILNAHLKNLPAVWAGILVSYIQALDHLQQAQMPAYFRQGFGLPLGIELHYLLAHYLLLPIDQSIRSDKNVRAYLRYLDDMLIFVENEPAAIELLSALTGALDALELSLNLHKTTVYPPGEAAFFLGAKL
ncbi:MAG: RNA-directed DNA polymerase [Phaeodactylibacter sp.]|nr:RNA-directed DNA polymerase [Phaeodactylibacter sp.]MCB9303485.1 RNA-directed DNA polymerase [Lewinellaceae bacterium]